VRIRFQNLPWTGVLRRLEADRFDLMAGPPPSPARGWSATGLPPPSPTAPHRWPAGRIADQEVRPILRGAGPGAGSRRLSWDFLAEALPSVMAATWATSVALFRALAAGPAGAVAVEAVHRC